MCFSIGSWIDDNYTLLSIGLTFLTSVSAIIFAIWQIKQNNRSYNHEISQRYIENYNSLMEVLELCKSLWRPNTEDLEDIKQIKELDRRLYYDKKFEAIYHKIMQVKNQAQLTLCNEIYNTVNSIYLDIETIIKWRNEYIEFTLVLESMKISNGATLTVDLNALEAKSELLYDEMLESQMAFMRKYFPGGYKSSALEQIMENYQKYTKVVR